jgi:hypothetical protein
MEPTGPSQARNVAPRSCVVAVAEAFVSNTPGGAVPLRLSRQVPEEVQSRGRAARYLDKHGPAVAGQGGNDHTYRAACILINDFCLPPSVALDVLGEWNQTCRPPWRDDELANFIDHASKYARGEPGTKLRHLREEPEHLFDALLWAISDGAPDYVLRYYVKELSSALPWWHAPCGQKPSPRSIPRSYRSRALRGAIGLYLLLRQRPPRRTRLAWLMGQAAYEYDGSGRRTPLWITSSREQANADARDHDRQLGASAEERRASDPWGRGTRTPEELVMQAQAAGIIQQVQAELSDLERAVLDNGPAGSDRGALARSNEALAVEYGTTPATIKQARHRIRKKAREFTEPTLGRSPVPWSTTESPEAVGEGAAPATRLGRRAARRPAQSRRAA